MQVSRSYTAYTRTLGDGRSVFIEENKGYGSVLNEQLDYCLEHVKNPEEIDNLLLSYENELEFSKIVEKHERMLENMKQHLQTVYNDRLRHINRVYEGIVQYAAMTNEEKEDAFVTRIEDLNQLRLWYLHVWNQMHKNYRKNLQEEIAPYLSFTGMAEEEENVEEEDEDY